MTDTLTCPCAPGCDYDTDEDCCSDACVCGDASTPTTSMRPPSLYEAKADGIHRLLGEVQELHEALACAEEDRRAHADQVSIVVEKADAERRENTRLRAENEDLTAERDRYRHALRELLDAIGVGRDDHRHKYLNVTVTRAALDAARSARGARVAAFTRWAGEDPPPASGQSGAT